MGCLGVSCSSPVQNSGAGDQRNYYTIVDFPFMGELYQQANQHGDKGDLVNMKPVLIAMSNAFEVIGGSSQRTVCEDSTCRFPMQCAETGATENRCRTHHASCWCCCYCFLVKC